MPRFANDPYETEYEVIQEIELLREGTWNDFDYTPEFIQEISESYDLNVVRAPLMHGHWGSGDGVIFGHVLSLRVEDVKSDTGYVALHGMVGFLPNGADLIESGQANERSISWWNWYPMRGFAYLLHLAFLSDANPASTGMEPIKFSPNQVEEEIDNELSEASMEQYAQVLSIRLGQKQKPLSLNWDKDDGDIRFRVRESSRFVPGSGSIRSISRKEGIRASVGNIKPEYLPEGKNAESLFNEYILFTEEKGWTLKKAKAWIQKKATLEADYEKGSEPEFDVVQIIPQFSIPDENVSRETSSIAAPTFEEKQSTPKTEEVPAGNTNKNLTAINAEGEAHMPTTDEAAKDGQATAVADEKLDAPITEPVKTTKTVVTMVEPKSIDDLSASTDGMVAEIEAAKADAQREYEKLAVDLKREKFEFGHAKMTAQCRQMLLAGFLLPSQFELGIVECLSAIPEEITVEFEKSDGSKIKKTVRDRLLEILKEGGRVKLKGEVSKHASIDDEDSGPNADLDKLDSQGYDTRSERIKRRISADDPEMDTTQLMIQVEKEKKAGKTS